MIDLLQIINQLVLLTPGTLFFHLMTILALLAIVAVAAAQWRRDQSPVAARTAIAGVILISLRFTWFSLTLFTVNPDRALAIIPPLDAVFNTTSALFILWAISPHPPAPSRLGHVLLSLALLIVAVMGIFFTLEWQSIISRETIYSETTPARIWTGIQAALFFLGFLLTVWRERTRTSLAPFLFLLLMATAVIQLFVGYESLISPWNRIGQLIVFPLWAVYTLQKAMAPLLQLKAGQLPTANQIFAAFQYATHVLGTTDPLQRQQRALQMVENLFAPAFSAIALFSNAERQTAEIVSRTPGFHDGDPPRQVQLQEWSPYIQLIEEQAGLSLATNGPRVRDAYALYELLKVGPYGGLLLEPLQSTEKLWGLLLVAAPYETAEWSAQDQTVFKATAVFLAQALANSARRQQAPAATEVIASPITPPPAALSARILALEEDKEQLVRNLETSNNRLLQAETRAATATKRVQELADIIQELEQTKTDDRVRDLEAEVASLREALVEAEDAMALASAGEGGLSAEWVMMTITRYSGQLEEAQATIARYQKELAKHEAGTGDARLISLIQELRTPMTSISGFTDLLLTGAMGLLGEKQREFIHRIKANTERMGSLLDQILQVTSENEPHEEEEGEAVDVQEVLETAVSNIVSQIREKNLQLDMDISRELPPLLVKRRDFQQILSYLLGNACQASSDRGRIVVTARAGEVPDRQHVEGAEAIPFLQVSVRDSGGGISPTDLPYVFDGQYQADNPLISGLGDRDAGLAVANNLAIANGGRLWVESELGDGAIFSLLFPLGQEGSGGTPKKLSANGSSGRK